MIVEPPSVTLAPAVVVAPLNPLLAPSTNLPCPVFTKPASKGMEKLPKIIDPVPDTEPTDCWKLLRSSEAPGSTHMQECGEKTLEAAAINVPALTQVSLVKVLLPLKIVVPVPAFK